MFSPHIMADRFRTFAVLGLVAAVVAGCEAGADSEIATQSVKQPDLLMYSTEWCLKRRADAAAGRGTDETPVEKLRHDGICTANLQSQNAPPR